MEDFKVKYYEALDRARKIYNDTEFDYEKGMMEEIFPELKESEDEKIRKKLIDLIYKVYANTSYITCVEHEDILAWLEKQGVQKSNMYDTPKISIKDSVEVASRMKYIPNDMKPIADFIIDYSHWDLQKSEWNQPTITVPLFRVLDALIQNGKPYCAGKSALKEVKEEKVDNSNKAKPKDYNSIDPHFAKPIDKVEPKFNVGDWIVGANNIYKIISLNDDLNCYIAVTINNEEIKIPYYFDDEQGHMCSYHLWSINDAKDGDVLASGNMVFIFNKIHGVWINCHCSLHKDDSFIDEDYDLMLIKYGKEVFPATKKQCDTLMEAMVEAGYTFDFEKKELNKITMESLLTSTWSEEDECYMTDVINAIATKDGWSFEEKRKTKHWLKSLKERISKKN